ncbi:2-amino-4-hydroxy-6-hydroxymethyldihydropteridine diphosphokinase [Vibrio sp. MA40-2]|uniref:2-amino-4-hydroxy-6- hydroxymethyldihydropteridine diphosphokinase n=1 Tax=Vibrio sp. MA40-2 TaxID=3391828 RepID=UPI0039A5ADA4
MKTVYIAIGSNLNDPVTQTKNAIKALKGLPKSQFLTASSLYSSTPMGPQQQPDYINAVVAIQTELPAIMLLDATQAIELEHGRVRKKERWGPRTLDLDILLYGNNTIDSDRLIVPHYGMKEREFVLYPLAEIAPNLIFPDGEVLSNLLSKVDKNGLKIWQS